MPAPVPLHSPNLKRPLGRLGAPVLGLGLLLAPGAARAGLQDLLIRQFCLAAIHDEVEHTGKPGPPELATSTCDCVVEQINGGTDLETAKKVCRARARQRFGL